MVWKLGKWSANSSSFLSVNESLPASFSGYFMIMYDYTYKLNSVAQQPIRPTVPISVFVTLDAEVHEQMFRSGGQSNVKPSVFSSQTRLVLIYGPTEGLKD
ncbi:hypothetical protein TNCV_1505921 [Trichonephila clavipes]|nr:hypothetical protein TNCV_1505921 [Trichonephila clavipes]